MSSPSNRNIRNAKEISSEYLKIQDEYLKERLQGIKITDVANIKTIKRSNWLKITCPLWYNRNTI